MPESDTQRMPPMTHSEVLNWFPRPWQLVTEITMDRGDHDCTSAFPNDDRFEGRLYLWTDPFTL